MTSYRRADWDYEKAHRTASESLIAATDSQITSEYALELLDQAEDAGQVALSLAQNVRQLVLELGFLQTVTAMRLVLRRGVLELRL